MVCLSRISLLIGPCLFLLVAAAGCGNDEEVRAYSVPNEDVAPVTAASMGVGTGGVPEPQGEAHVHGDLPDGWARLPDVPGRFAGFSVSQDDPETIVTVVPLGAGIPLLADVNRWEGQVGLPPSDEAGLSKVAQRIDVDGTPVTFVDLTGPSHVDAVEGAPQQQKRMLVAIVPHGAQNWYIKLFGRADTVSAQAQNFISFVGVLHFGGHDEDAGHALEGAADGAPADADAAQRELVERVLAAPTMTLAGYDVPPGWTKQDPMPMRVVSFRAGDGEPPTEVIVSTLGLRFGSLPENINRWRTQVGLAPLADEQIPPPERFAMGEHQAAAFDFSGPGTAEAPGPQRIRVAYAVIGPEVWFFKLQGPADAVEAQRPAFESFLQSLRFEPLSHGNSTPATAPAPQSP